MYIFSSKELPNKSKSVWTLVPPIFGRYVCWPYFYTKTWRHKWMLTYQGRRKVWNSWRLVVLGGDNVLPLVEIGLTDLPKTGTSLRQACLYILWNLHWGWKPILPVFYLGMRGIPLEICFARIHKVASKTGFTFLYVLRDAINFFSKEFSI